jgi:CspA family cold shock protein
MDTGTVRWFDDDKGFGFITPDTGSNDYLFANASEVRGGEGFKCFAQRQRVSYETIRCDDGLRAVNIKAL